MKRIALAALLCAGLVVPGAVGQASPVKFTAGPKAFRQDEKVRIDFAVDRPTDVAVFIEDGKGRIVRHLVAGVLGKNAPPPLKPNSLAQSILWDGKDDLGNPVVKVSGTLESRFLTPLRIRVALGLRPALEKFVGFAPADLGYVRSVAVGPGGEVFVFHTYGPHHDGDASAGICVFSREGRYLRTIMPYPANLSDEKLKGLKRIELSPTPSLSPEGRGARDKVPFIYQVENRSMVPGLGDLPAQRPAVTRDGRLAFVGVQEGPRYAPNVDEARVTVIHTDGSVPPAGVLKTLVSPATDTGVSLALSPDQKTLYAAGLRVGERPVGPFDATPEGYVYHQTWTWTKPSHAVYRFAWDDGKMTAFLGDPNRSGSGALGLNTPTSVATDKTGNVYVSDLGNHRIAVFKPDGRFLAGVAVKDPQRVEVHKRTGAIYVLAGTQAMELVKFDGYKAGKEVARRLVDRRSWRVFPIKRPVLALDDEAEPPLLWVNNPFVRVEDRGEEFGEPLEIGPRRVADRPNSIDSVQEMSLDRERGLLYINNYWRHHLATGAWERLPLVKGAAAMWPRSNPNSANGDVGRDGNYYVYLGGKFRAIVRYGPDLNEQPFAKSECWYERGWLPAPCRSRGRGLTADTQGNVYALLKKGEPLPGDAHRAHALFVYDAQGRLKNDRLIDASIPSVNSIRLDPAGNLYVAVGLRPGTRWAPPGLEGKLPEGPEDPDAVNRINGYPLIYGSIVKFGPQGGVIRDGVGGVVCNYGHGRRIEVKGARWIFPGASPVTSWATPKRDPGTINVCLCESPRFDVDGFGRSFFPDAARCRVGVIDTAGNEIGWFGSYGNPDSAGPGSAIPTPDIPLCWPQAVAVGDDAVYIGDRLNRRIVAVRLRYAAEATCPIDQP